MELRLCWDWARRVLLDLAFTVAFSVATGAVAGTAFGLVVRLVG